MGNQFGPIIEGIRYQHLYSWYVILNLLNDKWPYECAWIEHPQAGAADDLTLYPKRSTDTPARFIQIKHHRHRSPYTFDSLTESERSKQSLLKKLFENWRKLKIHSQVKIWLVSNKPPDQELGDFTREKFCFDERFFKTGPKSRAAKIRESWKIRLEAADGELENFCRDLRFRLGFVSWKTLKKWSMIGWGAST